MKTTFPVQKYNIALSFDIEEFDLPAEHGVELPFDQQIEISSQGLLRILDMMHRLQGKATFFCTARFAECRPDLIRRIVLDKHEVASHSFEHSRFETDHLLRSRLTLQEIAGTPVRGFRAPRMSAIRPEDLLQAGYEWDSSLNPCFIPGRYNNFFAPKKPFPEPCGLIEIPASVSPVFHIPLFWLALHLFPLSLYRRLAWQTLKKTHLLNVYFHPWEFTDRLHDKNLHIPSYIARHSGSTLTERLSQVVEYLKMKGGTFITLSEVAEQTRQDFFHSK